MKNDRTVYCPTCSNPVWFEDDDTVSVCAFCGEIVFDDPNTPCSANDAFADKVIRILAFLIFVSVPLIYIVLMLK